MLEDDETGKMMKQVKLCYQATIQFNYQVTEFFDVVATSITFILIIII